MHSVPNVKYLVIRSSVTNDLHSSVLGLMVITMSSCHDEGLQTRDALLHITLYIIHYRFEPVQGVLQDGDTSLF